MRRVVKSCLPAVLTAQAATVLASNPTTTTVRPLITTTLPLHKDVRYRDGGESRRLSFEERAERRIPKTKEQKRAKEQIALEADQFVTSEFPDTLERLFEKSDERCMILSMKVLNMAKAIERLEIEAPGAGGGGAPSSSSGANKKMLVLLQVANVVKVKANEIEIVPMQAALSSTILQRVSRFDSTLQVSKDQQKIRVVIPPMTTARRDRAAAEIESAVQEFKQRVKQARQGSQKTLGLIGVEEESQLKELMTTLDETAKTFAESKGEELMVYAEEVRSMGVDEADGGAAAAPEQS